MKRKVKLLIMRIAAVLLAIILLDIFCFWYYNPARYVWDEYRATDNVRQANKFTSRATEGIASATIDAYGYNNPSIPGEDGVSVLLMGSSHMEGYNVMQDETIGCLLTRKLSEQGYDGFVYNIGTSAHHIARNFANLERALDRFQPKDYVVIETDTILIPEYEINLALEDTHERSAETDIIISEWVTNRPLLSTAYKQGMSLLDMEKEESYYEFVITDEVVDRYRDLVNTLLGKVAQTASDHGVKLIIFHHPHLALAEDGSAYASGIDARCQDVFREACEQNEVIFLDMADIFIQKYVEDHILPHGFANTAPGEGHLNKNGNDMIAQQLCELILGGGKTE